MKIISRIIISLLIIFNLSGCVPQQNKQSNINISKADQLYIQVSALTKREHAGYEKLGLRDAEQELGIRTEYIGPEEYDISAMISAFEGAIAKKPKGILVCGFDPLLNSLVNKAADAGIPVATVEIDLPNSKRSAFIGTDNLEAGRLGGEKFVNLINGSGKIAMITEKGQSDQKEYLDGCKEIISRYPKIEIVQEIDARFDAVTAEQAVKDLIKKNPDLSGIVCSDAVSSAGAATAVRQTGMQGKIKIIGMDKETQVLDEISNGTIALTIVPKTEIMSYYALKFLYNFNNKEKNDSNQVTPYIVNTGVIVIDKDNIKDYKK